MIRFGLFIALLGSLLYWLSALTALPDVKPLETAELPTLLKEMEAPLSAATARAAGKATPSLLRGSQPSLRQALDSAVRRIERGGAGRFALGIGSFAQPSPLAQRLSAIPLDGLSSDLGDALRSPEPDLGHIAQLVLRDAEALPTERLDLRTDDRARLLRLSLEATREPDPSLEHSAPTWLNVGLRALEVPSDPDARDPVQVEIVRDAAKLAGRFMPDPSKRAGLFQKLEPIHPSPVLQGEIQQVLSPPPRP